MPTFNNAKEIKIKDSIEAAQRCYYLKTKETRLAKQKAR